MKWKPFVIAWALVLTLLLFAQRRTPASEHLLYSQVTDLTHAIVGTQSSSADHGASAYVIDQVAATRLEAPAGTIRGMWTVDEIPSERLVRPVIVIDVHRKARRDNDYRLSMQDVADWEQDHGRIPGGAVIMAYTGWDDRWDKAEQYFNKSADGTSHYPGFTLESAEFLAEARGAVALGIDTPSTDGGNSTSRSVHKYCAEHSVYHLENVANLSRIPDNGAVAVVTPLKLQKGTEAPVRLLALVH